MADKMIKLQAPAGTSGVSVAEVNYEVKDGVVEVPAEAVAHLVEHGFTVAIAGAPGTQAGAGGRATAAKGNAKATAPQAPAAPWAPAPTQA